jgi:hypothetical protein
METTEGAITVGNPVVFEKVVRFHEYEGELYKLHASVLKCHSCETIGCLKNKGPAGSFLQGNFKSIQLICNNKAGAKGCGGTCRLATALATTGLPEAEEHKQKLEEAKRVGLEIEKREGKRPATSSTEGARKRVSTGDGDYWKQKFMQTSAQVDGMKEELEMLRPLHAEVKALRTMLQQLLDKQTTHRVHFEQPAGQTDTAPVAQQAANAPEARAGAQTYAAKVKATAPARILRRQARKVLAPRTEPLEFAKMHLKIQDARPLKRTASAAEANKLLGETLRLVGVKKHVFAFSKIGNSILEIYVPTGSKVVVEQQLAKADITSIPDFNALELPAFGKKSAEMVREAIVKRLTFQYKRARLTNLRECILRGVDENICAEIRAACSRPDTATFGGVVAMEGVRE